jgi:hypothetical protein
MFHNAATGEGEIMKQTSFYLAMLFLICAIGTSAAQTLSYADAIEQLATACRADLQKYCRGVELGGGRLKACLDAKSSGMSAQCQQARVQVYASISRRIDAQRSIGDICSADLARLCGVTAVDANLVTCLLAASPAAISPACNQVFTDTGWRTERAQQ